MSRRANVHEALLVLSDGEAFEGEAFGAVPPDGVSAGEVVFNTALTGYQEIITDPSYAGQIVTFTYPHIGNYGVAPEDEEARRPFCRGVVIRDLARRRSNWRSDADLGAYLRRLGLAGIAGVDTRRLTRHLRVNGAVPGAFGAVSGPDAVTEADLLAAARTEAGTAGVDLVARVTTGEPYSTGSGDRLVVAYDFGMKASIVDQLGAIARVEVVPAHTPGREVLDRRPDGVFLSNGPGDPAEVPYAVAAVADLLDSGVPVFGICLGHQILGRAIGAGTVKLPFGHHGGNHPVRDEDTGNIEITSQNHNFAVDADTLAGRARMTHVNLNDGVCEGLEVIGAPAFGVQYHPEAGPGPHDARHLFTRFADRIDAVGRPAGAGGRR